MFEPESVAALKPISLRRSSAATVSTWPEVCQQRQMMSESCFLPTFLLMKPTAGGQISLKRTRPGVVSMAVSFSFPKIVF